MKRKEEKEININRSRLSFVRLMKGDFCKAMEPEHGDTGAWGFIGQKRELLQFCCSQSQICKTPAVMVC